MKHLLIAAVLLASPASAQNVTANEACTVFGNLADRVMELRQNGIPLSQMMALYEQMDDETGIIKTIIMGAYENPRYHTEQAQRRAIQDYRDEIEVDCYTAMGG